MKPELIKEWMKKPWIKHSGGCDGDSNHCCLVNDMQTFIESILEAQAQLSYEQGVKDAMNSAKQVAEDHHQYFNGVFKGYMAFYEKLIDKLTSLLPKND